MDKQDLINGLRELIGSYIKEKGFELVELLYRYEGRNFILRILVDKPQGGINIDECAQLNGDISKMLDEHNLIQDSYILEVSSPGVDRPLRTQNDFLRCINRNVELFFTEPIDGRRNIRGTITKVETDVVSIDAEGIVLEIPFSKIAKAVQVIDNI
ncbi:MAG: ribosome maturation factor RimP [Candidatus Omnitrophica bacterium]|nr:ribosome maturation factor RimP [Candidatus Omnitrophota bacterium]